MREDVYYGYPDNLFDAHIWNKDDKVTGFGYVFCDCCRVLQINLSYDEIQYTYSDNRRTRLIPPCQGERLPDDCYIVKVLTCKRCKNVITRPDGECVYGCGVGADENPVVLRKK